MGTGFRVPRVDGVAPHSNGSSFSAEATGFGPRYLFITSVTNTNPRIASRYRRKTTYGFIPGSLDGATVSGRAALPA
jgi:hypothetical protein